MDDGWRTGREMVMFTGMPNAVIPDQLRYAPFTTATAATYGVTRSSLKGSPWRHMFRDVWVHADVPDSRAVRLAAVRLVLGDGAFVCGLTAAWLFGIEAQDRRGELVWVGCRTGSRLRTRTGTMTREITVDDDDLQMLDGVPITTELRTVFDCARWLPLVEATVIADFLAHASGFTAADLAEYVATHRGFRGILQLERVIDLLEPLSESPMETRLRLLLVLAGLPRPVAQHVVTDAAGRFVARVDLAFVEQRLIVEYDGALHWEQRREDDRRRDALRALGWTVLVFSNTDYYQTPAATIATVRRALTTAA